MAGLCTGCAGPISRRNVSGLCRPCSLSAMNSDPDFAARVSAGIQTAMKKDPAKREAKRQAMLRIRATPKARESRRRVAQSIELWRLGNAAQPPGSPSRVLAGARGSATKLAWCPPELRDEYRFLTKKVRLKAAEARRMIEQQHELDMARWRRNVLGVEPDTLSDAILFKKAPVVGIAYERAAIAIGNVLTLDMSDILGHNRASEIVRGRHCLMLALIRSGMQKTSVGRLLGRDHSTVIHGAAQAEKAITEGDSELQEALDCALGQLTKQAA